jgi:uncharacterized peroxidase-related enzyme
VLPEYEKLPRSFARHESLTSTNLPVIEEGQAAGEVSLLYDHFRSSFGRSDIPGILKCFATHPLLLQHMMDLAQSLLFTDGYLIRRHKEMIATLISSQNSCPYCADSHGYFLRVYGGSAEALHAIQQNDLGSLSLTVAEQALLRFAEKVNRNSHTISREDVDLALQTGWSELQVAEAVHVAALFAAFNRVANAFGLPAQGLLALYETEGKSGSV